MLKELVVAYFKLLISAVYLDSGTIKELKEFMKRDRN
jgi:hypothetical protein